MWRWLGLLWALGLVILQLGCSRKADEPAPPPVVDRAESRARGTATYVGTGACVTCHEEQHDEWLGSHHDLSMQRATSETVLGDFSDVRARYYQETARFFRDGEGFAVEALGADGRRARFDVVYTFGVEPLQQYLVEIEPGRLQAFPFAWDTRAEADGGQRWFHLQPDEYIEPGDPLHWTGPMYNWNHACADCHSTAVKKGYDRATKRYSTEYFEIDVGCEACHGAGSRHVELYERDATRAHVDTGFERRFAPPEQRKWSFVDGHSIAVRASGPKRADPEACAPCHSRRADLGGDHDAFHDRYRLALLDEHLYFDDGQIDDEVFVYGSFVQSKMHAAGVVCGDCHDGHSTKLRVEGNLLCARCHRGDVYDDPGHHFHETGNPGSLCTDCHMPQRTYMVNDDRADHRFGVPRPALSARIGAPDACTGCHANRTAAWAENQIAKRIETRAPHPFADVLHAARNQQPGAEQGLLEIVSDGDAPPIVRATALQELRNLGSPMLPALLLRAAHDDSPVVRRTVAVAARDLRPEERAEIVPPLLRDRARTVRVEAVAALLGVDARGWSPRDQAALKRATTEYLEARSFNADRAEGLVDLAHVAALAGDFEHAEENLREALDLDPTFTAAYVNLADLFRSQQRDQEAASVLRIGLTQAADGPAVEFALGLALVRLQQRDDALTHLRRAYELRPETVRFGYVYAVAQYDSGKRDAALRTLGEIHRRYPGNRSVLQLLVGYNQQMGRTKAAERYAAKLGRLGGAQ